ncbi:MAG: ABC transporter permease [Lachnospiraceae bacterium]|nr:ABC transporter permease [Lachnospiraceae bacterium]
MDLSAVLELIQTTLELGLISSLTVLALFLSYSMLNVCDLSTDGCFTLGAAVGAMVALSGHPVLSIFAAIAAGMLSGLITALLQTKMGIDSLLSGIIVNTGLYSVNIAIMKNSSLVNLNKTDTIFTMVKKALSGTFLASSYKLIVVTAAVALVVVFLVLFLRTRLGLAIRATGDNPAMVRSSSINPVFTTIIGLVVANAFTGLSGCLMAQSQKSANIDIGSGMLTIALASLLLGRVFMGKGGIPKRAVGAVIGAAIFRIVYMIALRLNMPASMLKLVSSVIVIITISAPYFRSKLPMLRRRMMLKRGEEEKDA